MTIEIRPGRYISKIYFASGDGFDVMGSLYRDADEPFHLLYRFRYYDGEQDKGPHGDGDTKRWTEVVFERPDGRAGEDEAVRICAGLFQILVESGSMVLTVLDLRTEDTKAIRDALRAQPWAHGMPTRKPGAEA